jgi:hypothetical protein
VFCFFLFFFLFFSITLPYFFNDEKVSTAAPVDAHNQRVSWSGVVDKCQTGLFGNHFETQFMKVFTDSISFFDSKDSATATSSFEISSSSIVSLDEISGIITITTSKPSWFSSNVTKVKFILYDKPSRDQCYELLLGLIALAKENVEEIKVKQLSDAGTIDKPTQIRGVRALSIIFSCCCCFQLFLLMYFSRILSP